MNNEELTPEQQEMALYETVVEVFGAEAQVIVAIEEMAELTWTLTKWLRHREFGAGDIDIVLANVAEERADVSIMLNQLEVIFGENADAEVYKLEQLAQLLDMED